MREDMICVTQGVVAEKGTRRVVGEGRGDCGGRSKKKGDEGRENGRAIVRSRFLPTIRTILQHNVETPPRSGNRYFNRQFIFIKSILCRRIITFLETLPCTPLSPTS